MAGEKSATVRRRPRRVRPGFVLLIILLAAFAGALLAAYLDRDLLRQTAKHEVRSALERDLGLEVSISASHLQLLPLTVVLEELTLRRRDEPWVLNVEEAEISLSFSSLFFRGTGISNLRLVRPGFFYRTAVPGDEPAAPAAKEPSEKVSEGFDFPRILTRGLPFRALEIEEGEVRLFRGQDPLLRLDDLHLSSALSGGKVHGSLAVGSGSYRHEGVDWELGKISTDLIADIGGVTLRKLTVDAPAVEAKLSGTVDLFGELALEGGAEIDIAEVTARLGRGRDLKGTFSFRGEAGGDLRAPAVSGRLALVKPVYRGTAWPGLKGTVSYRGQRLRFKEVAAAVGRGTLRASGFLDLSSPLPEYELQVDADRLEPAALPALRDSAAAELRVVNGRLSWKGKGSAGDALRGEGMLEASFVPGAREGTEVTVAADALLEGEHLVLSRLDVGSAGANLQGYGSYRFRGDLSAWVSGGTGDLALFAERWGLGDYGGQVRLQGQLDLTKDGPRFQGPLQWQEGRALGVEDFDFSAELIATPARVSMGEALLRWEGAEVRAGGLVDLDRGAVDLSTAWQNLSASRLADLFQVKGRTGGSFAGDGRLSGRLESPLLEGHFRGSMLRYGDLHIEKAEGKVTVDGERLEVSEATFTSGESLLTFSGAVGEDRKLAATFESSDFDLLDFMPESAAEVLGSISGSFGGTVERPDLEGKFQAKHLKFEAWRLTGTAGTYSYRDGTFTLRGNLVEEGNTYRLNVEPAGEWPFEIEIALARFSPEIAREGFAGLPPRAREALEGLSFLAVGNFEASGYMRDEQSILADLRLEKVLLYTEEQTLENLTPMHVSWMKGTLTVDPFSLAGEGYRFAAGGRAGLETGWDLSLDGDVNLALFKGMWEELEAVDAPGRVHVHLSGEWERPEAEGQIEFHGGSIKLRSLPDPILDLKGKGEFRRRIFHVSDFSGVMGEGAFIGGGSYDLESNEIDAVVEGRFDLGLFKARVPVAREMKGPVEARLSLKGPASQPQIMGEARLQGAEVLLLTMPVAVSGLAGSILIEEGRLELREVSGRMGNGDVSLHGAVDWRVTPPAVDLSFTGRRLTYVVEDTAKALLDADLALSGDFDSLALTGKIAFIRARYFRDFKEKFKKLPKAEEGKKEEREGKKRGPDFGVMKLDVNFTAPDRFWIKNRTADLENSVDIHLGGTLKEPLLDGEISLLRGEVTYFSKRFSLYSGRIYNEPPGIEPVVEAQAEVQVSDVTIFLLLEGPLRKPLLQLTSVPPLSQEDLIALLTVGQTRSTLEEEKGEALAVGAALVFTSPIIEQVGEGARDLAGLELLQVEPSLGEERAGAKVTVGTQLSDRLFMSASQSVGVTDEQQVRLEYQLLDYISVLGQQLRQGIYSLDLVFQYNFD